MKVEIGSNLSNTICWVFNPFNVIIYGAIVLYICMWGIMK